MKQIIISLMAVIVCICASAPSFAQKDKSKELSTVVFATSLHCENCKKKIENNIAYEKGVKDLKVDVAEKTVTVTYRKDKTDSEKLRKALEKLGYTVLIKEETKAE